MNRVELMDRLVAYPSFDDLEESMRQRMIEFADRYADCFWRSQLSGHFTASCWVVDPGRTRTLLCWHKRLDRWLQMGGHLEADDASLLDAATRELREESGLARVRPLAETFFDLDVHPIPAKGSEAKHDHYDIRFLFEADPAESLVLSPESRELAWVALDRVAERNADTSMLRMVAKTRAGNR